MCLCDKSSFPLNTVCEHSVILSFCHCHSVILSLSFCHCHSVVLSFCRSVILSFYRSVILSFCHSVVLSFCRSVILSFCHSVILSFCRSVILSFCHISALRSSLLQLPSRYVDVVQARQGNCLYPKTCERQDI
jgi:hypothetical protein